MSQNQVLLKTFKERMTASCNYKALTHEQQRAILCKLGEPDSDDGIPSTIPT